MAMTALLPWKGKGKKSGNRRPRYFVVGTVTVSTLLIGLLLGMTKPEWQQYLDWGFTTREVHTKGDYFTLNNSSKVKLAGVEVGRIDNVTREADGTALMKVRIKHDVIDKVGTEPSAVLRPATLLGGIIYMDLRPGGDRTRPWEDDIPLERTALPVELSQVVQSLQPDAVKGIPTSINALQGTLANGGTQALQKLAAAAPPAFGPGAGVIDSLSGYRPGTDLPDLVNGLQRTSSVLSEKDGQIESIVKDLKGTTGAFAASSAPTAQAIDQLPAALDTAIPGLQRLNVTLDTLQADAAPIRPSVQQLDTTLQRLNPTLVNARPVVADLRAALPPTRALVQDLVPTSTGLQPIFNGLDPSLTRLNGPVLTQINSGNPGAVAPTSRQGDPALLSTPGEQATLREELTPFFQGLSNTTHNYEDGQGHQIAFNVGFGSGSIGGTPDVAGLTPTELYVLLVRQFNPNFLRPIPTSAGTNSALSPLTQGASPLTSLTGGN